MDSSPIFIYDRKCHNSPLVFMEELQKPRPCEVCKGYVGKYFYACLECDASFHHGCVRLPLEVNHPSHRTHPLKIYIDESPTRDAEKTCLLCGADLGDELFYRCSICNFNTCLICTENPPPLTIDHQKTHEHELLLMARHISFECNACGMQGDQSPYMCIQCGFVIHQTCIHLPRVININRHDHRISFTHHIGVGYSKCRLCRQDINQYYGAYSCSLCPTYAVHSLCATRKDVWDGVELEGTPEDDEDISPFIVVGDNLIKHFSHEEHNLKLTMDNINRDESSRCEACVLPIDSHPIYNCEECHFILHEECANLPKKKRHAFSTKRFTLWTRPHTDTPNLLGYPDVFICWGCGIKSTGFRYIADYCVLDVRCASLSEPFIHDGDIHPLYYEKGKNVPCDACHIVIGHYALCCDTCEFDLHLRCADLPKMVKHSCDDHPLSLCYGEDASAKYWCDICEAETDPSKWFYTCSDCGVTVHIECVFGDFSRIMPGRIIEYSKVKVHVEGGRIIKYSGGIVEVVPNNHSSRPVCAHCQSRCRTPFILKVCDPYTGYICSDRCATSFYYHIKKRWHL